MSIGRSILTLATTIVAFGAFAQSAKPPAGVPMMSMDHVAQQGFFYVGGEYVGEGDQVTKGGAMYVEVVVRHELQRPGGPRARTS